MSTKLNLKSKPWRCRLSLHDWKTETRGMQYKGNIYPLRFRHCLRCDETQKEVFDEINQTANWVREIK